MFFIFVTALSLLWLLACTPSEPQAESSGTDLISSPVAEVNAQVTKTTVPTQVLPTASPTPQATETAVSFESPTASPTPQATETAVSFESPTASPIPQATETMASSPTLPVPTVAVITTTPLVTESPALLASPTIPVPPTVINTVNPYPEPVPTWTLIPATPAQQALVYAREDRSLWLWQPNQEPRQLTVARPLDDPEQPANENAYLNWAPSPDGRYVLYSHGKSPVLTASPTGGIHLVPLTGAFNGLPVEQTLVEEAFSAAEFEVPFRLPQGALAWSPDSQQLAFVSYHELPTGAVYVANLDDLTPRRVADWPARALTWSPDGTYLAFMRADLQTNMGAHLLAWVPADGSAPARILESSIYNELEIDWSNDEQLAVHIQLEVSPPSEAIPPSQFALLDPVDGSLTVLYEYWDVPISDWSEERNAFVAALYQPLPMPTGIYLISTEGQVEPLVTDDEHISDTPFYMSWSPDGQYIIWRSDLGACEYNFLYFSSVERQTLPYCDFSDIRWSPDNRYLYTHWRELNVEETNKTLTYRVFDIENRTLVAEGTPPAQLSDSEASWSLSPNGRYVATIQPPQRYLGKGTGVATANLFVDKWGESGNLVDEQATTWGPGVTWIPEN